MLHLLVQRLFSSLLVFSVVGLLVFTMVELLPGDAASAYLGRNATPERLLLLRAEMGLNRSAPERFVAWAGAVLRGDLGTSLTRGTAIDELLWPRLRNSLLLGLLAMLISVPLALGLGILAGLYRNRWPDNLLATTALFSMSLPEFVVGTLLIFVFSLQLGWLPAVTLIDDNATLNELWPYTILPLATLTFMMSGYLLSIMRNSIIDALKRDHVQMARLKGLSAWRVLFRHALPSAMAPAITASALIVAWMIGNLVVIEAVFNYPGIGTLALTAIQDRDLPVVQSVALVLAGCYLLINLLADLLVLAWNPQLRTLRAG
jgi:peptide/nickel transport system permease protein